MTQLAIIEDNINIRGVLKDYFTAEPGFEVVFCCGSFEDFCEDWQKNEGRIDVVICDIGLPGKSGIDAVWYIKNRSEKTHVLMLTVFEQKEKIFQSLCAGASGYMLKSTPLSEIKAAIGDILNGGAAMSPKIAMQVISYFNKRKQGGSIENEKLTAREIEILSFLEQGLSNKSIADQMNLSIDTVKFHIKNIYLKLQVTSRAELIAKYRQF
ncbi:DNA-binding response regulator, NarL/FixJ family, contains REC and HTH domains [Arachidicoccus rhizosphaerae]|uniref:DNA-binding response regulator, NarL/FixJ family, contains REC and HTH domains n=1 Tax=Arachidicoccus rhizosphaerae TaxID=551991 RepID=A0A1H3W8V6_9BACT|nr:response regulator transcription factor [Arachidicoccus rhizosphaerae]SDZ82854.1 DNA-binding response regulator, NarL/FixJ family, contains REC and HTH domains [Arachidicoccus rhizosphaerae]